MTAQTTVTVIDHTSDAGFRAWVAEWITQAIACGLTQTSDTGQINTTTVTRPGVSTDGGYAIFRFNDTLQSTAPIFFKVFFGTDSAANSPRIRLQQGTASNGSGTVSGTGSTNTDTVTTNVAPSTTTTWTSRWCYVAGTDGCFWFAWKEQPTARALGFYIVGRTTDSTGAATADGCFQGNGSNAVSWVMRSIVFGTATIYTAVAGTWLSFIYGITSSLVGGVPQAYKAYMITPRVQPLNTLCGVIDAECARGVQFQATLVGTTQRNYINAMGVQSSGTYSVGLIWE